MKKITFVVLALLAFTVSLPAGASEEVINEPVTVAIVDTAFDSSLFGDSVLEEVCITAGGGCNNRTGFELGKGSSGASISVKPRDLEDWSHGNLMAKTVLDSNPDAKLLLIRNAKVYGNAVLPGTEKDLAVALQWLVQNGEYYNVVAVSISRGSHSYVNSNREVSILMGKIKTYESMVNRLKVANANPRVIAPLQKVLDGAKASLQSLPPVLCPNSSGIKDQIVRLADLDIATVVAAGNDADKTYVDYPACIEEAVSVTAHNGSEIVYVGNISSTTDFAALASTTSEATARLAGLWSLKYRESYLETYDIMKSSGIKYWNTVLVP